MQHLDEGTIHAWLDGALSAEDSARAEAHVASCATCAEAVAEARGLIAASSRILTALDNVPSVRGPVGAGGAARKPFLVTWLVRERIAAVAALIVAVGALSVMMSRRGAESALLDTAAVPVTAEVAAPDTVTVSVTMADAEQRQKNPTRRVAPGRGGVGGGAREQDLSATRKAEAVSSMRVEMPTQVAVAQTPPPAAPQTDDSIRGAVAMDAPAARRDTQALAAEEKFSVAERLARVVPRRRDAAEVAAAPLVERGPQVSVRGAASIGAQPAPNVSLLQEEQMKEGGRDVRRRIYRVDDLLVTLDERAPGLELEQRRAALSANVVADSTVASVNTIQWTDARGFELSLTGAATKEKLEQIRRALGY